MKRHLFFFLYPVSGSPWRWHVDRLIRHKDVFNGKKVVVVARDGTTDPPSEVMDAAAPLRCAFMEVENDPVLGEVPHFHKALERFESLSAREALFYAHGKGTSRRDFTENILAWSECMYHMNLSCPDLIDLLLMDHAAVGAFRHEGQEHGGSFWHFSGTFFWLRHDALFSSAWKRPYTDRHGVEGFPGRVVTLDGSFSLTGQDDPGNLYLTKLPERKWLSWMAGLKERFGLDRPMI